MKRSWLADLFPGVQDLFSFLLFFWELGGFTGRETGRNPASYEASSDPREEKMGIGTMGQEGVGGWSWLDGE